jgi:hypothetical protein
VVRLLPDAPYDTTDRFGAEMSDKRDVDGDGNNDLLIVHPSFTKYDNTQMYVFYGAAVKAAVGTSLQLVATQSAGQGIFKSASGLRIPGNFANAGMLNNFDNANAAPGLSIDLVYGMFKGYVSFGKVFIRLNRLGLVTDGNLLPYEDLVIEDPFTAGNTAFGGPRLGPVGDVNGDSFPDLLIGTSGSGYAVLAY